MNSFKNNQPYKIILVFLISLFSTGFVFSQGNTQCQNPTPFCTANPMNFPAQVNAGQAQQGPFYGCLGGQPNPNWFFMQIATPGSMSINISSTFDIDFITWGPFPNLTNVCNNLTQATQVPVGGGNNGCSFSGSPTETLIIANAQVGEFYVVLVTNWSNQVQNIQMNQTGGTGATNCGIICSVTPVASGPICPGGTASLSATTGTSVNTYTWVGPSGVISNNLNGNVVSGMLANTVYTLRGSTSTGSCQATTMVTVVPFPVFAVTPTNIAVCQNQSYIASVIIGNAQNYTYQWVSNFPYMNLPAPNSAGMQITTNPIPTITASTVYSVIVTPTILNCPVTATLGLTINNPPLPILAAPAPLCNTLVISSMTANPAGGTWYGNPIVGPTGIITPNSATQFGIFPVNYSISVGICTASNSINLSINEFRSSALTAGVPNQCFLNNPFNLMSIVQNNTGTWAGIGVNVAGTLFNPSTLPTGNYLLNYITVSQPNPNVCQSITTTTVQVLHPLTPTINPILPQCTNSPTVQLTATPGGGTWTGNGGVNILGWLNPANVTNPTGVNSVVYTAGQGTCVVASTATFFVSRFNTSALTNTSLALCANSPTVNLMSLVQSTANGSWSGFAVNNNAFNPASVGAGLNAYTFTYNTTSSPNYTPNASPAMKLCNSSSTLFVSVLSPIQPTIVQLPPICNADAPIQLQASPPNGIYIQTQYLNATGLLTPSLTVPGNNQVQYMVGTSTCNAVDSKTISVEAFVPATITAPVPDQCKTGQVISLLPYGLNTGNWTGPGVAGSSFNPGMSGVGNIVIVHHTSSSPSGLCPDQKSISVAVYSLAVPAITPEGPYCNSHAPVTIKATPVGGKFESSSSYAVSTAGVFNPAFAAIGQNVINYSVAAGPCIAFASTFIQVEEFVSADFSEYVLARCKNNAPVDLNSYAQRAGGNWSGPGMLGSIFTPSNANVGSNNIVIYRTHSQTEFLCPDSSAMRITVNDVPNLTIVADQKEGCAPTVVNFNIPNTNSGEGSWYFGDATEPLQGLSATRVFPVAGTYSVVFNYLTPETRCSTQAILKDPIRIYEVPQGGFTYGPYDEIRISEPEVQLINQTSNLGDNTYLWQIDNLYSTSEINPKTTFNKTGEYRITLTATNTHGCTHETTEIIVVEPDFNVFIPNSFSPNFDGTNDEFFPVFSPFGLDPKTYEMEIFDRWGKSLFLTKDINKGWNGTNKGGNPMKQEVYVYRIKYKDLEGRIYTKIGNVTLIN